MNEQPDRDPRVDPFRQHQAQNWWPQPPSPDAPAAGTPPQHGVPLNPHSGQPSTVPAPPVAPPAPPLAPPAPSAPAPRSALRDVGVGALGLVAGLVIGLIIQDAIGIAFLAGGASLMSTAGVLLGWLLPTCAVAGVVAAVLIDRSVVRKRGH